MPDNYSIVVLGGMNPNIHHPQWYESVGVIATSDRDTAVASDLICIPQHSQFTFGTIRVVCTQNRWEVQTLAESDQDRILNIACKTFDVLAHTPVVSFGFNFNRHSQIGGTMSDRLAQVIHSLNCGLSEQENQSGWASFHYHFSRDNARNKIVVEPSSDAPDSLYIQFNAHHSIHGDETTGNPPLVEKDTYKGFDLGAFLKDSYSRDRNEASRIREAIVASFKRKSR